MNKNYELVIFDLDGTLLDTSCGILAAITHTLESLHIPPKRKITAHGFIGPPIEAALQRNLSLEGELLTAASKEFRRRYKSVDLLKATPYEGIEDLLITLRQRGYGRAVATYKREAAALRLLWHYGLDRHLNVIHGTNDDHAMTKAEIILRCIEDYGLSDRRHAVMVGDAPEDAIGAATAGVDFVAVTYGFGFTKSNLPTELPCIGVAASPTEILSFLGGDTK